ncbi:hypothetical protein PG991_010107 [Apiospora marii]|uniref:Uncharacterized protein n=1 Tax=Apiospora marii TaxID=335849 RepID=A0ABR1RHI0_9PEZI
MQIPMGRVGMAASPAASKQQNIVPRQLMPSYPSATPPEGGGRMQHPVAAPPGSIPPPPPPHPPPSRSSTGDVRVQAPPRAKSDPWAFVSGIMTTDDRGNPLRTPEHVANTLHRFIYQPANKMPQADAQRADSVIDLVMVMSGTWPFHQRVQYERLRELVGLLLQYNSINRETLGRAISGAWLNFELGNRPDYTRQLTGFVMQIHLAHWQLLRIPLDCLPLNPDALPTWVDLLVPHYYLPPAQAVLEASAKEAGLEFYFAAVSNIGAAPPSQNASQNASQNLVQNPSQHPSRTPSRNASQEFLQQAPQNFPQSAAPTNLANLPMMQRPMPEQAPQQLPSLQPQKNPSQIPQTNAVTKRRKQRPNQKQNTNMAPP